MNRTKCSVLKAAFYLGVIISMGVLYFGATLTTPLYLASAIYVGGVICLVILVSLP